MQEYTDLRSTFDALYKALENHAGINGYAKDLLGDLHIAFSNYEHSLNIAKKQELEKEVSRLEKVVSDGFAEYYKLFQESKRLKNELETLKKITFE